MLRPVHADDFAGRRFHPARFNCWHFVAEVWERATGRELPDLTPSRGELRGAVDAAAGSGGFVQLLGTGRLEPPQVPAIVLFRRDPDPPHVGVWLRGRVLHLVPSGARSEELRQVCPGSTVTFWTPGDPQAA